MLPAMCMIEGASSNFALIPAFQNYRGHALAWEDLACLLIHHAYVSSPSPDIHCPRYLMFFAYAESRLPTCLVLG